MTTDELKSGWASRPPAAQSRPLLTADAVILGGLCAVIAASVLAAIMAMPGEAALLDLLTGLLLLAATALAAIGRLSLAMPLRSLAIPIILTALCGLWIALQASAWLPAAWHHPLWALAAAALPGGVARHPGAVSLDPGAGAASLAALLRDAALFWIAYNLAAATRSAWRIPVAVAAAGAALAAWTLALRLPGLETAGPSPAAAAIGAGIAYLTFLALAIARIEAARPGLVPPASRRRATAETALLAVAAAAAGAAALVAAPGEALPGLVLGTIALAVGIAAAPSLTWLRRRPGTALAAGILAALILVAGAIALHRLGAGWAAASAATGLSAREAAVQALADSPLLGTGAGTLQAVLSLYGADVAAGAPGSYLQALVELGIPAALALFLACCGLAVLCVQGVRRRHRNAVIPALGLAASLLIVGEAITGRTLQEPLPALLWCALMGAACAQARTSRDRQSRSTR